MTKPPNQSFTPILFSISPISLSSLSLSTSQFQPQANLKPNLNITLNLLQSPSLHTHLLLPPTSPNLKSEQKH